MNRNDFKLIRVDKDNDHEDYWFETNDDSERELLKNYAEQGCEHIFEVVYSKDEDFLGIKRQFLFNFDVVESKDEELKNIFRDLCKGGRT